MSIDYNSYDKLLLDILTLDNDAMFKVIRGELRQYAGKIHTDERTFILFYPEAVKWTPVLLHARYDVSLPLEKVDIMLDSYQSTKNYPAKDFSSRVGVYTILKVLRTRRINVPVLFTTGTCTGMHQAISLDATMDCLEGYLHAVVDVTLPAIGLYGCAEYTPQEITEVFDKDFVKQQSFDYTTAIEYFSAEYNVPAVYVSASVSCANSYCSVEQEWHEFEIQKLIFTLQHVPYVNTFRHKMRELLDNANPIYGTAILDTPIEDMDLDETPRCSVCGKRKFPQTYFHQAGNLCVTCEKKVRSFSDTGDVTYAAWIDAMNMYLEEKLRSKIANALYNCGNACPKCGNKNIGVLSHSHCTCTDCKTDFYVSKKTGERMYIVEGSAYIVEANNQRLLRIVPQSEWFDDVDVDSYCLLCGSLFVEKGTTYYNDYLSATVCDACNRMLQGDFITKKVPHE